MNDFDQAARYAAKLNPAGFFHWLVAGLDRVLVFRGWLDTRTLPFPGEPDRTCDTVGSFDPLTGTGLPWAIVVEFQSEPEADMLERLHEYVARFRREQRAGADRRVKYQVAAALVNLTGPVQPDTLEMLLPIAADFGLRLKVVLRTMREESAAATLAEMASGRVARCLLPWIPLMHGAAEPAIMEEWKRLAEAEPESRLRADYAGLALVFADLAGRRNEWRQALEGWNVRRSQQVLEWQTEGEVRRARVDVLRALQIRFQDPVPTDLVALIESLTDLDELSRWHETALKAESLGAFRAVVQA
jgi:hypothetical protein